jgi:hypothetical protein
VFVAALDVCLYERKSERLMDKERKESMWYSKTFAFHTTNLKNETCNGNRFPLSTVRALVRPLFVPRLLGLRKLLFCASGCIVCCCRFAADIFCTRATQNSADAAVANR